MQSAITCIFQKQKKDHNEEGRKKTGTFFFTTKILKNPENGKKKSSTNDLIHDNNNLIVINNITTLEVLLHFPASPQHKSIIIVTVLPPHIHPHHCSHYFPLQTPPHHPYIKKVMLIYCNKNSPL